MKKLLLLLPVLVLGISAAVWQNYQNEPTLSDTALANIEALAGNGDLEGDGEVTIYCDYPNPGRCWEINPDEEERLTKPCVYNGKTLEVCE